MRKLVLALGVVLWASAAGAQTQSLVPNAMVQFLDANGVPLAGGSVFMYVPGTTTPKTTYKDPLGSVPNTQPIVLDGSGRAIIWGQGEYREVVLDQFGNTIWDQLTFAGPVS